MNTLTILGMGNILCGDDGFGCHVAASLQEKYSWPENVAVIDGGTQGQLLPSILHSSDKLLLIDAADFGNPPGHIFECANDEIPKWLGVCKLSAHQGSLAECLALAQLKSWLPQELHLIGLQPCQTEFGSPLSSAAIEALPKAEELVLRKLALWGIIPQKAANSTHILPELRQAFDGTATRDPY